jgi:RNA polymerase sigma-70 factor (ECF subfamily)
MLTTSRTLLDRLKDRQDAQAWQLWLTVYEPWLRDWLGANRLQPADVDDLLQNILVVVSQKLPTFVHNGRPGAFRAWLRGILVNELRYFLRGRHRQSGDPLSDWLDRLEDPNSELSRQWDVEHDQQLVRRLLGVVQADFQPQTWELFRLLVLEDRPAAEVSRLCRMELNAVYVAKSRVLARLRHRRAGSAAGGTGQPDWLGRGQPVEPGRAGEPVPGCRNAAVHVAGAEAGRGA